MPFRFFFVDPHHFKMIGASSFAVLAATVDAVSPAISSYESIGLKTVLIAAIIYLVRELSKQRDQEKAEVVKREEKSEATRREEKEEAAKREEVLIEALKANQRVMEEHSRALQDLRAATDNQTGYFKTVAQTLLSREITPKLP